MVPMPDVTAVVGSEGRWGTKPTDSERDGGRKLADAAARCTVRETVHFQCKAGRGALIQDVRSVYQICAALPSAGR